MCVPREFCQIDNIACVSDWIQICFDSLSIEEKQMIYMFFVCDLNIADISDICQSEKVKVLLVIIHFLTGLVSICKDFPELFVSSSLPNMSNEDAKTTGAKRDHHGLYHMYQLLIHLRRIRMNTGVKLADLIAPCLLHSIEPDRAAIGLKLRSCVYS